MMYAAVVDIVLGEGAAEGEQGIAAADLGPGRQGGQAVGDVAGLLLLVGGQQLSRPRGRLLAASTRRPVLTMTWGGVLTLNRVASSPAPPACSQARTAMGCPGPDR